MLKYAVLSCAAMLLTTTYAEPPVQGAKPTNVLGTSDQHASFSFVRPGLTQTAFAFTGPSSHQSFSSSIGNARLAQKVLPNVANALAYRNPGLGLGIYSVGPIANGYAVAPAFGSDAPLPLETYQAPVDPATLAYYQQLQQIQQPQVHSYPAAAAAYQAPIAQLLALRQAQVQAQAQAPARVNLRPAQTEQVQELAESPQEEQRQPQSLLGIAYSSAPSVARVKVSGNGYEFDF